MKFTTLWSDEVLFERLNTARNQELRYLGQGQKGQEAGLYRTGKTESEI